MASLVPSPVRFICPGAQKAATSTLHAVLQQHPKVFLPDCKETHFFDEDHQYERGGGYYRDTYYAQTPEGAVAGDITPKYLYDPRVPGRIVETLGRDLDIVILLRDPVTRAYSHYWMRRGKGFETRSFADAARAESELIRALGPDHPDLLCTDAYLHRGLYTDQVGRYLEAFGPDRVLCLLFEDFVGAPEAETARILGHLGLDPVPTVDTGVMKNEAALVEPSLIRRVVRNPRMQAIARTLVPGPGLRHMISRGARGMADKLEQRTRVPIRKPPLDPDLRAELAAFFASDVARLGALTGLETERWAP